MIPVELVIEGIYSYRERTTVNFQPLLAAQLFGIFGAVGSGKSSLLEAITFALYGQVERMTRRDSLAANIFNLEADRALIDFTFDSLVDRQRYRCVASGKRRKQGPELSREFFQLTAQGLLPVEESQIHEAIGLSYDHFTRTVIVPQGKFQAFLQLTDKERTDMLQDLFHLHRFDMTGQMRTLIGKTRGKEQHLSGRLAALERWLAIPLDDLYRQKQELELGIQASRLEGQRLSEKTELYQRFVQDRQVWLQTLRNKEQLERDWTTEQAELTLAREELRKAKSETERLPEIEQRIRDLTICLEIQTTNQELLRVRNLLQASASSLAPLQEKREVSLRSIDQLHRDMAEALSQRATDDTLSERRSWMLKWEQLEGQRRDKEQSGKDVLGRVTRLTSLQAEFWQSRWDASLFGIPVPADPLNEVPIHIMKLENHRIQLEESIRQQKQHAGIGSFGDLLKEGLPCPLCGSTHHPDPVSSQGQWQQIVDLEHDHQRTREALQALRSWLDQSRDQANQLTLEKDRLDQMRTEYQQIQVSLLHMNKTLASWEMDLEGLRRWLEVQQDLLNRISQWQSALSAHQQQLKVTETELDQLAARSREMHQQEMKNTGRLETLLDQVAGLAERHQILENDAEDINRLIQEEMGMRDRIRSTLEMQQQRVQTREEQFQQLEGRINELNKLLTERSEKLQTTTSHIYRLDPGWEEEAWQAEPETRLQAAQHRLSSFQEQLTQQVAELALLENRIKETSENQEEARQLTEERNQVLIKLDNLKILEGLFRAKGMVDFAASRYLRQILEQANQRFYKMTRHKLRLELSDDLRILVRDYYHGGAVRSVKTLSGGQLFQASLALALSMAGQIRTHRKGERDFFFLDEGFGTQDRESLAVVLDTLKALREENRSVGIISHVEDLQQEVNASLRIHLDPVRGSLIEANH